MEQAPTHLKPKREELRVGAVLHQTKPDSVLRPMYHVDQFDSEAGTLLKELRATAQRAEMSLAGVSRTPWSLELRSSRFMIIAASVGTLTIIILANRLAQAIL
ncbi:MAG: hypothetical protein ABJN26_05120 [Stappiaceae bacterium]